MGRLAANALRTKNMIALLTDMGIKEGTKVSCVDERVILNPATSEEGGILAIEIQTLLQTETVKPPIRRVTLNDLLGAEIDAATCSDLQLSETNKRSLHALLPILGLDFALDEQQEYLDIKLPSLAFASLFGSLTYKYMTLEGETLRFNVKEFLNDHRKELVLIDGKKPVLLCNAAQFENKKVFYARKRLSEDEVQVTPHVFIPTAAKPPHYHFVLDTSDSMKGLRLAKLKESVLKFADALFKFQPDATIDITEFNSATRKVGSYGRNSWQNLSVAVNQLSAQGGTRLYGTTLAQLSALDNSNQHNNILLFTDGENTIGNDGVLEEQLKDKARQLKDSSPLIPVRNKFFIISYGAKQPKALEEVTEVFSSPVINTNSSDFVAALSESDKLQEWAAARELFTCRLEVTADNSTSKTETYARAYDLSGQFTALDPICCKDGEALHLTIVDGDGQVLLEDTKPAVKKAVVESQPLVMTPILPDSVKTATHIGVFAVGEQVTDKTPVNTSDQSLNFF